MKTLAELKIIKKVILFKRTLNPYSIQFIEKAERDLENNTLNYGKIEAYIELNRDSVSLIKDIRYIQEVGVIDNILKEIEKYFSLLDYIVIIENISGTSGFKISITDV